MEQKDYFKWMNNLNLEQAVVRPYIGDRASNSIYYLYQATATRTIHTVQLTTQSHSTLLCPSMTGVCFACAINVVNLRMVFGRF